MSCEIKFYSISFLIFILFLTFKFFLQNTKFQFEIIILLSSTLTVCQNCVFSLLFRMFVCFNYCLCFGCCRFNAAVRMYCVCVSHLTLTANKGFRCARSNMSQANSVWNGTVATTTIQTTTTATTISTLLLSMLCDSY